MIRKLPSRNLYQTSTHADVRRQLKNDDLRDRWMTDNRVSKKYVVLKNAFIYEMNPALLRILFYHYFLYKQKLIHSPQDNRINHFTARRERIV